MSLRTLFTRLYAEAEARGEASAQLHGGASVRVRASGTRRQVILSRAGAPIGLIEAQTFEAYGRIPDHAEAVCYLPTREGCYRVAYTWEDAPAPAPRFEMATSAPMIYTAGYGAGWSPEQLRAEVGRLGARLWDIRYRPWSRSPQWQGPSLRLLLSNTYSHIRELGNVNYQGGPIQLLNPAAVVAAARAALDAGPLVLLCGCKDAGSCHRSVAAAYLAEALGGVEIVHLAPPAPPPAAEPEPEPGHTCMTRHAQGQARATALARAGELLASRRWRSLRQLDLPGDIDDVDRWIIGSYGELTIAAQAAALGVGRPAVHWWRRGLRERGLLRPAERAGNRPLTDAERDAIVRLAAAGYSRASIAAMREISPGRVAYALDLAGHRYDARPRPGLGIAEVAELMGQSHLSVWRWVRRGWLPDLRVRPAPFLDHGGWSREDLVAVIRNRETWLAWSPSEVADPQLRRLAEAARREAGGAWVTTGELGELLGLTRCVIRRWIVEDGLFPGAPAGAWAGGRYLWLTDAEQAQLAAWRLAGDGREGRAGVALRARLAGRFGRRAHAAD